jgi:hypothetical protein
MGVGEDFSTFKDNYQISTELIGSISSRYIRVADVMESPKLAE